MSPELLAQLTYAFLAVILLAPLPLAGAIWSKSRRVAKALLGGWAAAAGVTAYGFWRVDRELSESATGLMWFFFYTPALSFAALIVVTAVVWAVLRLAKRRPPAAEP